MISRILKYTAILVAVIILGFVLGPEPEFDPVSNQPISKVFDIATLDAYLREKEENVAHLKEDNEARIVWADSSQTKTPYSIVYLHGFTASQGEGFPMHLNIQKRLGANMYLPRLPEHGVAYKDAMKHLTPKMLVDEAREAIAIGKSIGERVIVMGCSTGGTLAIYLASGDPDLEALVLLSPNIEIKAKAASMVTGPWGQQLAYSLIGEYRDMTAHQKVKEYWTDYHHTNGLIALQDLIDQTMKEEYFQNIQIPVYCGYYFKNDEIQDPVVSVDAMLAFKEEIATPPEDMEFEAFASGNHVLASEYKNEGWEEVQEEIWNFIQREVLE